MTTSTTAALSALLAAAAACWLFAIRQMGGMNMGVTTELGSFGFFVAAWVPMMAAMMLPGAAPAVARRVRADGRVAAAMLFAALYLGVWAVIGLPVYALYRPHGTLVAGALIVAAGVYELTPIKRECRRRCRESVRSGLDLGRYCVGSSIGLMVVLLAVGVMSVAWMVAIAIVVLAQKVLPPAPSIDVPLALAILALGIVVAAAPSSAPI